MVNSRKKGNTYEVKLMNEYKDLGFKDCMTSRNESKATDDKGIDLCYTDPFNIQAKAYKSFGGAQILRELKNMTENTIDHRLGTNYNLVHLKIDRMGELVCISKSDWYEILELFINNQK